MQPARRSRSKRRVPVFIKGALLQRSIAVPLGAFRPAARARSVFLIWPFGGDGFFSVRAGDDVDGEVVDEAPLPDDDFGVLPDEKIADVVQADSVIGPSPDVHVAFIFTDLDSPKSMVT
ncbi:unnamed protein product [Gongylonema pulchrum]|uniref:Uncharacterized protein n=1 Tax=Gongylonema pulchrum TaxID=637853 RepID=A0A183EAT4_9BILA|nr:unnamed protein product [Gongylonema pulchrum]